MVVVPESESSLEHLAAFLRVIRVPRADVKAMLLHAPADPWGEPRGDPGQDGAEPAPGPARVVDGSPPAAAVAAAPGDDLPAVIRGLYAVGGLDAIGEGRAALVAEALQNRADGRLASAVALAITQIDGIAADVPPTPWAAFPFLIDDPRPLDEPDPLIDAAVLRSHPGTRASVTRLMRTSRPDTNTEPGLHRHGIMHGRDLTFGTAANADAVFALLAELVAWATPIAQARAARSMPATAPPVA